MAQRLIDEIQRLIDDTLTGVHTAMPGTITAASGMTASVKPSVTFKTADGKSMAYPNISGCPIVLPMSANGKIGVAFPVSAGDACLIVCCESTLSQWQSGNYQSGLRFGLSNAICVPCLLKSAPAAVAKAKAKNAAILFSEENEVLVGKDEIHAKFKDTVAVKIDDEGIVADVNQIAKVSVKEDEIFASLNDTTKASIKDKEIVAQAGDEDHEIVVQEALALLKCKEAKALLSDDIASLQLNTDTGVVISNGKLKASVGGDANIELTSDSVKASLGADKRVEVSNSAAGIYYDSGHYIESKANETYVEGNLHVGGSLIGG